MHYFAKESLMKSKLARAILGPCNLIPVNRDQPTTKSIKQTLDLLKDGRPVLLFPEGTRSKDGTIKSPKRGVGLIAAKAGVPVLSVWVKGTYSILPAGRTVPRFKKITVVYGIPFTIDMNRFANQNRKEAYLSLSGVLLDKIKSLRDKYEAT
jgi:1-acyl-sn-glycerol-3-phosphate acyltransferase